MGDLFNPTLSAKYYQFILNYWRGFGVLVANAEASLPERVGGHWYASVATGLGISLETPTAARGPPLCSSLPGMEGPKSSGKSAPTPSFLAENRMPL